MARINNSNLLEGAQGAIGKKLVVKRINGKSFLCQFPNMSDVQFNEKQKKCQSVFAQAVAYAQEVLVDADKTLFYKQMKRNKKNLRESSIYHLAIQDYIGKNSKKRARQKTIQKLNWYQQTYSLSNRQLISLQQLLTKRELTNSIYQQLNQVSKATATRDLQNLVYQGILSIPAKGVGARYVLVQEQ
ncbi:hypothetical protein [Flavihumibacter sp. UBA7668]|uniref:hypothetical protein n=1 Tax=Flavihumibacter sp. UBA7668 TaxID=1946542 RepID=UPI0025C4BFF3|nr:hypothetical protein [Flavihumibacter sp. UBA7668]